MSKLSHSNPNLDDVPHEGNESEALTPQWLRHVRALEHFENASIVGGREDYAIVLLGIRTWIEKAAISLGGDPK